MIISASRRTDIPAFYAEWFFNRLREGYVLVRNPFRPHQLRRISLRPDVVDGIVFWTKNPSPMLEYLPRLRDYMYCFQFTLNPYGRDAEPGVPPKGRHLVPVFQRLSDCIGPERVIWRYDPIFLNASYTVEYHIRYFEELAKRLSPYTRQCTCSFLDFYRRTERNTAGLSIQECTPERQRQLMQALSGIAHSYGLQLNTCAEEADFSEYGVGHARCIDRSLWEKLLGCPLSAEKDKNQRPACGCMESVDIGAYNTCLHGCRYCYANFSRKAVQSGADGHDPQSPLLTGTVGPDDVITDRILHSCRQTPDNTDV